MLKLTLSSAIKKTRLAPRTFVVLFSVIMLIVCAAVVIAWRSSPAEDISDHVVPLDNALDFEIVKTVADQQVGLSGRDGLAKGAAMLFAYDEPGQRCIWMKDMKFSIDIVWLNGENNVARVLDNVAPETYPETFCVDNAKYVIEMSAGRAEALGLSAGKAVTLGQ